MRQTMTLFENCSSKQSREVTWQEVFEMVRDGQLRTKTEAIRKMSEGLEDLNSTERKRREKEVKRMKATWFPGLMAACHCQDGIRRLEQVTGYTGCGHVDFDHLTAEQVTDIRTRLREVPEVLLMHTSMRGHGLHVYYRMEPAPKTDDGRSYQETYIQGFRQGNAYFAKLAGAPYDPALEPPVHLSCLCHDPEVFFNPEATAFNIDLEHPVAQDGQGIMDNGQGRKRKKKRTRRGAGDERTKAEMIAEFLGAQPLRYDVLSRKIQVAEGDNEKEKVKSEESEAAQAAMDCHWQELTERRLGDLFVECNKAVGRNVSMADLRAVLHSGVVPEVNPLREYVNALPEWDGESDHIGLVARMVKVKSERVKSEKWLGEDYEVKSERVKSEKLDEQQLWEQCFRKWFCAMVASWMDDRVVNHQVLVLIGEQGIFKTTWLDALMPPELVQYRCRQTGTRAMDKDEQLRATEFGLINMDEIDRMSEQELNALKSLITATDVNVRAAYAQSKERRLRVASYVASGNKDRFLTDTTGNRRWLPFHVAEIRSPFEHPLPYEGLYAQAWALVRQGFNYWFSLDEIHDMAEHVEAFSVETNEEQLLPMYFSPCQPGTTGAVLLTVAEISAKLVTYGAIRKPMDVRQLGTLLRKMGYESKRVGHKGQRAYVLIEKTADAINAERKLNAAGPSTADNADIADIDLWNI